MASTKAFNEDKVALLIGCFVFLMALGKFAGLDLLGWGLKMGMWVNSPIDCWSSAPRAICLAWALCSPAMPLLHRLCLWASC